MTTATIGLLYGAATLLAMFAGMPIAFALGAVATVFMIIFMPAASVDTITQNVYEEMASITLLSIPLFILKGAAIGRSRAGQDLYGALHAWMHRIPGGLASPMCLPVRCLPPWLVPRPRPVRRSARPAFRKCASAAIRAALPPALSR